MLPTSRRQLEDRLSELWEYAQELSRQRVPIDIRYRAALRIQDTAEAARLKRELQLLDASQEWLAEQTSELIEANSQRCVNHADEISGVEISTLDKESNE
jgi:hypothetical protein